MCGGGGVMGWGWVVDGLMVSQLNSGSIGPKLSPG